jgi:hypothetical protein
MAYRLHRRCGGHLGVPAPRGVARLIGAHRTRRARRPQQGEISAIKLCRCCCAKATTGAIEDNPSAKSMVLVVPIAYELLRRGTAHKCSIKSMSS